MWQRCSSGGGGISKITPIIDFNTTKELLSQNISTSGYKYIFVSCLKSNSNPRIIVNSALFSVSDLSVSKIINIPKSITGWSKDYSVTINSTSASANTDNVGIAVFGIN